MEALRDRTVKLTYPILQNSNMKCRFTKRTFNSKSYEGEYCPHTIEMASMWAILTRLEKPKKLTPVVCKS